MTTDWSSVNDGGILKMLADQETLYRQEVDKSYKLISNKIKQQIQSSSSYPIIINTFGSGLAGKEAVRKIQVELNTARPWKRFKIVTKDIKGEYHSNSKDGDWQNPDYRTIVITIDDPEQDAYL